MLQGDQRFTARIAEDDQMNQRSRGGGAIHLRRLRRSRTRTKAGALGGVLAALALMSTGCGGSSSTATTTPASPSTTPAATAVATTTTTTSTSASETGLSGQWKGEYSGAYTGTFVLHWQQSGSSLSGKITGTLHGSAITFGTVGSLAITYTGTVSGGSMSGSYQTPGGGGDWSASKS